MKLRSMHMNAFGGEGIFEYIYEPVAIKRIILTIVLGVIILTVFNPLKAIAENQSSSMQYDAGIQTLYPTPVQACLAGLAAYDASTNGLYYSKFKYAQWEQSNYYPAVYLCYNDLCLAGGSCSEGYMPIAGVLVSSKKPLPSKNMGVPPKGSCQGNPCNAGNGNKVQSELDFFWQTNFALRAERIYNSGVGATYLVPQSSWGAQWLGFYDRSIPLSGLNTHTNTISLNRQDGKVLTYALINGVYVGDSDISGALTKSGVDGNGNPLGWTYLNENDEFEVYGAIGQLISITNRVGQSQVLQYSDGTTGIGGGYVLTPAGQLTASALPAGLLVGVVDQQGRTLKYGYDAVGRIVTITDPSGAIYLYSYSDQFSLAANLVSVAYPDGHTRLYLYGENSNISSTPVVGISYAHSLTGIIDENGDRFASWTYNALGQVVSSEHGSGGSRIQYVGMSYGSTDTNGNASTSVVDALGTARTYNFGTTLGVVKNTGITGSPCSGCTAALFYDSNGNVSSQTDFNGNSLCYEYDMSRNLETSRVEGLISGQSCPSLLSSYVPAAGTIQRKTTTIWHPTFRLPVLSAKPLKITTWIYNGQPDPTNGNAIASCAPSTAQLPNGMPIAVLCKQVEQETTDINGGAGFAAAKTSSSQVLTWTYNTSGQILTATSFRGNIPQSESTYSPSVTQYSYYSSTAFSGATPNKIGHTQSDLASVTNPLGQTTTFNLYDTVGRILQMTDPKGIVTNITYTPRGWVSTVSTTAPGQAARTTTYTYDGVGQVTGVAQPDGTALSFSYDAAHRLVGATDARGNTVAYTLDNIGNRISEQVKDPSGTLQRSIARSFDALNRLQQITGAKQ